MKNPWDIDRNNYPKDGSLANKIRFVLGYGILAPSTHNTQPWLFKIKENSVEIYYDPKLMLPEGDPRSRDLYISMGCLIENTLIASGHFKILGRFDVGLRDSLVAEIFFKEEGNNYEYADLLDTIPQRVNSRGLFKPNLIPEDSVQKTLSLNDFEGIEIHRVSDKERILKFAELTASGLKMAHGRPRFRQEMSRWMHNSLSPAKEGLHGYSLRMPFLFSFIIPWLVRFRDLSPMLADLNYKSIASVPLVNVISAQESNPETWLKVGRLAQRTMLYLNSQNIKTSIFVASIEMGDLHKEVQKLLNITTEPQFLFVAGYMDYDQKHSPRHNLEEKLL